MNTEPVAIVEGVKTLLIAVMVCLLAFDAVNLTDNQQAAVLGVYGAAALLVQLFFVRNQVTPVNKD